MGRKHCGRGLEPRKSTLDPRMSHTPVGSAFPTFPLKPELQSLSLGFAKRLPLLTAGGVSNLTSDSSLCREFLLPKPRCDSPEFRKSEAIIRSTKGGAFFLCYFFFLLTKPEFPDQIFKAKSFFPLQLPPPCSPASLPGKAQGLGAAVSWQLLPCLCLTLKLLLVSRGS